MGSRYTDNDSEGLRDGVNVRLLKKGQQGNASGRDMKCTYSDTEGVIDGEELKLLRRSLASQHQIQILPRTSTYYEADGVNEADTMLELLRTSQPSKLVDHD